MLPKRWKVRFEPHARLFGSEHEWHAVVRRGDTHVRCDGYDGEPVSFANSGERERPRARGGTDIGAAPACRSSSPRPSPPLASVEDSDGDEATVLRYGLRSRAAPVQAQLLQGGFYAHVGDGTGLVVEREAQREARDGEVAALSDVGSPVTYNFLRTLTAE